ncbi:hypothetical protein ACFLU5_07960 [Bacteroidota bacterium]
MKTYFLILLLHFFPLLSFSQDSDQPTITLKAGIGVTGNYGKDFTAYQDEKKMYYQPALSGGVVVKNFIYVGMYASKFQWYKKELRSHERKINALELGYPIKGKHVVGITFGKVKTWYPYAGHISAELNYESNLYGVFVDYKICKYLSIPLHISISEDPLNFTNTSWHIAIGITGNLPISF